jgi:hypothetical protein
VKTEGRKEGRKERRGQKKGERWYRKEGDEGR